MDPKNLYIKTFGCQMNVYDSERIAQSLNEKNYRLVEDPTQADLIFLNTCSIREKPEEKVYSALGRFRKLKKNNPRLIIGVGGCVAQQEGKRLLERIPYLDFVLGTKEFGKLHELITEREKSGRRGAALSLLERMDPYHSLPFYPSAGKVKAFVSVMQGCDNFCSFCVVPYVRGREVSRPSEEILGEIRLLALQGVKEVTLIGQNVNSYGQKEKGEISFRDLLEAVQEVEGIERIRFVTSHPKDFSRALIEAFGQLPKLCEHIHLPLQSGSNRVLQRMNRGYSRLEYLEKIAALRRLCPDISITTDIIVGFPGEAEEDFQATLEIVEEVQFDDLFSFQYSDRPQTRASSFSNKILGEVSRRRLAEVQEKQKKISAVKNKSWEGRDVEVLVEGRSKANGEENMGRTRSNRVVNFSGGNFLPGSLVPVRIQKALDHSLRGESRSPTAGDRPRVDQ
jgi:tRNA-2-methylthio-N6-dimethylallyladenosine synthase